MEGQQLRQFFEDRLGQLGMARKDIPHLLGYTNSNKCLRNLDRLLGGYFDMPQFVDRITASPLGGDDFQVIYVSEVLDQWNRIQREIEDYMALQEDSFTPHLWVMHERDVPRPLAALTLYPISHFKRVNIPSEYHQIEDIDDRLTEVARLIRLILIDEVAHSILHSVFGEPVSILYRVEYRLAYVYDIKEDDWVGFTKDVPRYPLFFTHRGKRVMTFKR